TTTLSKRRSVSVAGTGSEADRRGLHDPRDAYEARARAVVALRRTARSATFAPLALLRRPPAVRRVPGRLRNPAPEPPLPALYLRHRAREQPSATLLAIVPRTSHASAVRPPCLAEASSTAG